MRSSTSSRRGRLPESASPKKAAPPTPDQDMAICADAMAAAFAEVAQNAVTGRMPGCNKAQLFAAFRQRIEDEDLRAAVPTAWCDQILGFLVERKALEVRGDAVSPSDWVEGRLDRLFDMEFLSAGQNSRTAEPD